MAEFKVIYRDGSPCYQPGCPVQIVATQVSRDTSTAQCYLQTKVRNVSRSKIGSVALSVTALAPNGESEPIEVIDLDADIESGDMHILPAIKMHSTETKALVVQVARVDNLTSFSEPEELPEQCPLKLSSKAAKELRAEMGEAHVTAGDTVLEYRKFGSWWMCLCGAVNSDAPKCCQCGAPLNRLQEWSDSAELEARADSRSYDTAVSDLASGKRSRVEASVAAFEKLAKEEYRNSSEQAEAAQRKLGEMKTASDKRNKMIAKAASVVAVIAIAAILVTTFIVTPAQETKAENAQSSEAYELAKHNMDLGNYGEAQAEFEALGDYKDSASQAKEAYKKKQAKVYQQGVEHMEAHEYDKAYLSFSSLGDYSDSKAKADEAKKHAGK